MLVCGFGRVFCGILLFMWGAGVLFILCWVANLRWFEWLVSLCSSTTGVRLKLRVLYVLLDCFFVVGL